MMPARCRWSRPWFRPTEPCASSPCSSVRMSLGLLAKPLSHRRDQHGGYSRLLSRLRHNAEDRAQALSECCDRDGQRTGLARISASHKQENERKRRRGKTEGKTGRKAGGKGIISKRATRTMSHKGEELIGLADGVRAHTGALTDILSIPGTSSIWIYVRDCFRRSPEVRENSRSFSSASPNHDHHITHSDRNNDSSKGGERGIGSEGCDNTVTKDIARFTGGHHTTTDRGRHDDLIAMMGRTETTRKRTAQKLRRRRTKNNARKGDEEETSQNTNATHAPSFCDGGSSMATRVVSCFMCSASRVFPTITRDVPPNHASTSSPCYVDRTFILASASAITRAHGAISACVGALWCVVSATSSCNGSTSAMASNAVLRARRGNLVSNVTSAARKDHSSNVDGKRASFSLSRRRDGLVSLVREQLKSSAATRMRDQARVKGSQRVEALLFAAGHFLGASTAALQRILTRSNLARRESKQGKAQDKHERGAQLAHVISEFAHYDDE